MILGGHPLNTHLAHTNHSIKLFRKCTNQYGRNSLERCQTELPFVDKEKVTWLDKF